MKLLFHLKQQKKEWKSWERFSKEEPAPENQMTASLFRFPNKLASAKRILPLEQKSKPDSEEGESNCKREMEIDNFPDLKKDSDAEIQKAKNVSEMKTEFAGEMEIDNFPDLSMNPWERKL